MNRDVPSFDLSYPSLDQQISSVSATLLRRSSRDDARRSRLVAFCLRQAMSEAMANTVSSTSSHDSKKRSSPSLPSKVGSCTFVTLVLDDILDDFLPLSSVPQGNSAMRSGTKMARGGGGGGSNNGNNSSVGDASSVFTVGQMAHEALAKTTAYSPSSADGGLSSIGGGEAGDINTNSNTNNAARLLALRLHKNNISKTTNNDTANAKNSSASATTKGGGGKKAAGYVPSMLPLSLLVQPPPTTEEGSESSPSASAKTQTDGFASSFSLLSFFSLFAVLDLYLSSAAIASAVPYVQRGGAGPRAVFICGQGGVLLRSIDSGKSWRRIRIPNDDEAEGDEDHYARYEGDNDEASRLNNNNNEGNSRDAGDGIDDDGADDDNDDNGGMEDETKLHDILSLMMPTRANAENNNGAGGGGEEDDDDDIEGISAYVASLEKKGTSDKGVEGSGAVTATAAQSRLRSGEDKNTNNEEETKSTVIQDILDQHKAESEALLRSRLEAKLSKKRREPPTAVKTSESKAKIKEGEAMTVPTAAAPKSSQSYYSSSVFSSDSAFCQSDVLHVACGVVSGVRAPPRYSLSAAGGGGGNTTTAPKEDTFATSARISTNTSTTPSLPLSLPSPSLLLPMHELYREYFDDIVVVCGQNGLLAVSVDRGGHFTRLPAGLLRRPPPRVDDSFLPISSSLSPSEDGNVVGRRGVAATTSGGGGGSASPAWFRDKTSSANEFVSFLGATVVPNYFFNKTNQRDGGGVSSGKDIRKGAGGGGGGGEEVSSPFRVIFHTTNRVFSIGFTPSSMRSVTFSSDLHALVGARTIGLIGCVEALPVLVGAAVPPNAVPTARQSSSVVGGKTTMASSAPRMNSVATSDVVPFVVVVTSPSAIHLSLDGGRTLCPIEQPRQEDSEGKEEGGGQRPMTIRSNTNTKSTTATATTTSDGGLGVYSTAIRHQAGLIKALRVIPTAAIISSCGVSSERLAKTSAPIKTASMSAGESSETNGKGGETRSDPFSFLAKEVVTELHRDQDGRDSAKGKNQPTGGGNTKSSSTAPNSLSGSSSRAAFTYTASTPLVSSLPLLDEGIPRERSSNNSAKANLVDNEIAVARALTRLGGSLLGSGTSAFSLIEEEEAKGKWSLLGGCSLVALATDGPLVNFDFTCLLHLCVVRVDEESSCNGDGARSQTISMSSKSKIIAVLDNVNHTPFVASGPTERVGLGVFAAGEQDKSLPSSQTSMRTVVNIIRSNRAGISVSSDFGRSWSQPLHAYTGAVCLPPQDLGRLHSLAGQLERGAVTCSILPPPIIVSGSKQCVVSSDTGFLPTTTNGCGVAITSGKMTSAAQPSLTKRKGADPHLRQEERGFSSSPSSTLYEVLPIASQHRVKMLYGAAALW